MSCGLIRVRDMLPKKIHVPLGGQFVFSESYKNDKAHIFSISVAAQAALSSERSVAQNLKLQIMSSLFFLPAISYKNGGSLPNDCPADLSFDEQNGTIRYPARFSRFLCFS